MDKSLSAQWTRIRGRLRAEYGEAAYRSWLKPLTLCGCSDGRVKLSAPTRFMRDWVDSQYGDRLGRLWKAEIEEIDGIDIILEGVMSTAPAASQIQVASKAAAAPASVGPGSGTGNDIGAPLDPRFTFDEFRRRQTERAGLSPRPAASPRPTRCRSIRCSSTAASASARPI